MNAPRYEIGLINRMFKRSLIDLRSNQVVIDPILKMASNMMNFVFCPGIPDDTLLERETIRGIVDVGAWLVNKLHLKSVVKF